MSGGLGIGMGLSIKDFRRGSSSPLNAETQRYNL